MLGCGLVSLRRLGRVVGTAVAVTAVAACLSVTARADNGAVDGTEHPPPTATPRPTATPAPTPRPSPTATPRPSPTAEPTPTAPATAEPKPTPEPERSGDGEGGPPPTPTASSTPAAGASLPPGATPPPPQATPSLVTEISAVPAAVAAYAQDAQGNTSPYVVGADALAGLAVASSLSLSLLRRRGLL